MSQFRDREKAFEAKFAHDEEVAFRVMARRNKLLGHWAAELMGIEGEEADTYARDVIRSDFIEAGDDDVFRKIRDDLAVQKIEMSDHRIRRMMEDLLIDAKKLIMEEMD